MENEQIPNHPSRVELELSEAERLVRFFAKLAREIVHLQADVCQFERSGDTLKGAIRRGETQLKSLTIRSAWFEAIVRFLKNHSVGFFPAQSNDGTGSWSAVRCGDDVVHFSHEMESNLAGLQRLTLRRFSVCPLSKAIDLMGMMPYASGTVERMLASTAGILVLGGPTDDQMALTVNAVRVITGWGCAGSIDDPAVAAYLRTRSKEEAPILVSALAVDALDLFYRVKQSGIDANALGIRGFWCQGFVRRTCEACARPTPIDPNVLKRLPDRLRTIKPTNYAVGRGCSLCAETGYRGSVGVQSLFELDHLVASEIVSGSSLAMDSIKKLYARELRPLLEDGLCKAFEGVTTLEAVLDLAPVVPDIYRELWRGPMTDVITLTNVIPSEGLQQQQASSASALTLSTRALTGGSDSAPLFGGKGRTARPGKPLLLVVEDDPDQRSILELTLTSANYEVFSAEHGADALRLLADKTPDLIVSDLMMPVMDGAEFVLKVKTDPRYHKIPILMLTVIADEDREYALLDLGADDYCEKTIQRKLLLKRIEKLIERGAQ